MLKVSENPPIVWPEDQTISGFKGQWWVAHTKSRNEKALANDLVTREVQYFLPMAWSITKRSRRTFKSLLPLFAWARLIPPTQ